jgi:segregation and condensation protein A
MTEADELVVDLDGFEGPISLLLSLAREQKVDLRQISILALADQYLAFIESAERMRLELAADYLVMAAWLAFLKSRLLLPDPPPDDEPSGAELAAALQRRLERLAAMQNAGAALLDGMILGRDVFPHGQPEGFTPKIRPVLELTFFELIKAYADQRIGAAATVLEIKAPEYYSVDDALERLGRLLGTGVEWRHLASFLPPKLRDGPLGRSVLAATFAATLELAKAGRLELRQDGAFAPIYLRAREPRP